MKKGHIKITLECAETQNKAIFEVNMNDQSANFNLDDYDIEKANENPLLGETFVAIIDMLGMREMFLKEMENIMSNDE